MTILEFGVVLAGLFATLILFRKFPLLGCNSEVDLKQNKVSVIIPARNEADNLAGLLDSLQKQSFSVYEIICVDDDSTDNTEQILKNYNVKTIFLKDKPKEWTGKSWACKNGADIAKGELYLFLDADVRLGKDAVKQLVNEYNKNKVTISVKPYHITYKIYEQFSLFFNLVETAASGALLKKPAPIGLFGPVILISKQNYNKIGGHSSVKYSIAEDIDLGAELKSQGLSFKLFAGDKNISYRMYGDGIKSLIEGWTKNIATGAVKTSLTVFILVFLWITAMLSVPIRIAENIISFNLVYLLIYIIIYFVWVIVLSILSKKIGRFNKIMILFYPILLFGFLVIISVSFFKKIFGLKVKWKGRTVLGRGKCK